MGAPSFDRGHARAREDKWMLEIERAMWAVAPGGDRPSGTMGRDVSPALHRAEPEPVSVSHASRQDVVAPHKGNGEAQAEPVARRSEDQAPAREAESAPARNRTVRAHEPAGWGRAGEGQPAQQQSSQDRVETEPGAAAALVVPRHAGLGGDPIAGVTAADGSGRVGSPLSGAVAPGGAVGVTSFADATPPEEQAAPTDTEQGAAPGAEPVEAEIEPYGPRNIHVVADERGVRAWIRDAALNALQARAVSESIVAEFMRQGTVVSAVMVNGRLASERDERETYADGFGETLAEQRRHDDFIIHSPAGGHSA